ncbi:hypothetical protein CCACVL1_13920, partial [Corchorus capsularis]
DMSLESQSCFLIFGAGSWLLWNDNNVEVERLCKGRYEMHADIEPVVEDSNDE